MSQLSSMQAFALSATLLLLSCWPRGVLAQEPFVCSPGVSANTCEKRRVRHAREHEERARDEHFLAYGREHPWRLRVQASPSLSLFGLGGYWASMWGIGLGPGVQREYGKFALRMDALFRLGSGRVSSLWAPQARDTGPMRGAELAIAGLFRPHPFYVGPMLDLGFVAMDGRDFTGRYLDNAGERRTVHAHVPGVAVWGAVGVATGFEVTTNGHVDLGARALIGLWHEGRLYLHAGVYLAVVLWD
jgi:hypothetical protein